VASASLKGQFLEDKRAWALIHQRANGPDAQSVAKRGQERPVLSAAAHVVLASNFGRLGSKAVVAIGACNFRL